MKVGTADLPLHYGKAPSCLFQMKKKLAKEIIITLTNELGHEKCSRKISDPFWFQVLGCTLGFDWHSSGVTTHRMLGITRGYKGHQERIRTFYHQG